MEKISQNKAKCKYCSVDFACAGGNTSGLMRHVRSKHPTDEHWSLMEELLPVLQPLQVATALFSAADTPSASTVFPTVVKLLGKELAATDDDSPSTRTFKVCKKRL